MPTTALAFGIQNQIEHIANRTGRFLCVLASFEHSFVAAAQQTIKY